MAKLIPLEEAAGQLGITPDALNEMRQRQEIYGYRDGASWKFKPEDVERLAAKRAGEASGLASGNTGAAGSPPVEGGDDEGDDMVLLSEFELGESGPSTSSTVIGKPGENIPGHDSDIQIGGGSDVRIGGSSAKALGGSSGKVIGGGSSGKVIGGGSSGKIPSSGGSSTKITGSDAPLNAGDDIPLDLADSGTVDLGEGRDSGALDSLPLSSGSDLTLGSSASFDADDVYAAKEPSDDSTINLGASEHDELVLGGSGPGSDITISPGDSGISLVDPSDSGLSLEEPLELSAADDSSFDLSSDSSGSSGDEASDFDSDAVMELKGDDDFLLTPLEESTDDESQDSGSQVIALDSEAEFEESPSPAEMGAPGVALLEAEEAEAGFGALEADTALVGAGLAGAPAVVMTPSREGQFTGGTVIALSGCVVVLAVTGTMMFDLVRNMWMWDSPYPTSSFLMDNILNLLGG